MDQYSATTVTGWLRAVELGDEGAAEQIWHRFFADLVGVARNRLGSRRRFIDEEDVAVSVFDTLFRGAAQGRFSEVSDRQELWRLMVTITAQKARFVVKCG